MAIPTNAELDFDMGLARAQRAAGRYRNAMLACKVHSGAMVELQHLDGMLQALFDLGYLKPGPKWPGKPPFEERDAGFRIKAAGEYECEVEIDNNALISCVDPEEGAYVQAWVWVGAGSGSDEDPNDAGLND